MRVTKREGALSVRAIAGTHVVLVALDCAEAKLAGLMGFALKRQISDVPGQDWLKGLKVFKSQDPAPKRGAEYSTLENPIQSFLWSDYTVQPDTSYIYTVVAMYGRPGALTQGDSVTFTVKTEKTDDGKHGIWFNRGAIAGQAFAREFETVKLTDAILNNPKDRMTGWLSRGLLDSCLDYIGNAKPKEALRISAYEFTYPPVLAALKNALADGVDVQIVYHKTPENESAIEAAGIPAQHNGKTVLFGRWKTKIPHSKFILRLDAKGEAQSVWAGSTNFTASGFLGQTNVGHLVHDSGVAKTYLAYWQNLSGNPGAAAARDKAMALTPNPANAPAKGTTAVFSPRMSDSMIDWYADRIADAKTSIMFTGASGIDPKILAGLEKRSTSVRFVLLETPPDAEMATAELEQRDELLVSYGPTLGYESKRTPQGGRTFVPIARFPLDEWFLREELDRPSRQGFIFFLHTKILLIDALADDPLVCTGSANFSSGSLTANDENMLQIRGDTRVADIYLTEFDRIFRQFYFRDVADDLSMKGRESTAIFLDESGAWVKPHFEPGTFDCHRREMFFIDTKKNWSEQAATDADRFADEKPAPLPPEPDKPPARVIPIKVVEVKEPPKPVVPPQPIVAKPPLAPPVVKPVARPLVPPPIPMKPAEKPGAIGPTPKVPPKPPTPPPSAKPPARPVEAKRTDVKPAEKAPPPTVSGKEAKVAPPAKAPAAATSVAKPAAATKAPPPKQVVPAPAPVAKPAAKPAVAPSKAPSPAPKPAAAKPPAPAKAPAAPAAKVAAPPVATKPGKPPAPAAKPPVPAKPAASAAKASAAKPAAKKSTAQAKPAKPVKPAKPIKPAATKPAAKPVKAKAPAKPAKKAQATVPAKKAAKPVKPVKKPVAVAKKQAAKKSAPKPAKPVVKAKPPKRPDKAAKSVKRAEKAAKSKKKATAAVRKPAKKARSR